MGEHLPHYVRDERPWGYFEQFTHNEPATVKLIIVRPGEAFSLQRHEKRDEFWRILQGRGKVILDDSSQEAQPGMEFFIPRGTAHRAEAKEELQLLEISFGEFDEEDIVRIEDNYGRA